MRQAGMCCFATILVALAVALVSTVVGIGLFAAVVVVLTRVECWRKG